LYVEAGSTGVTVQFQALAGAELVYSRYQTYSLAANQVCEQNVIVDGNATQLVITNSSGSDNLAVYGYIVYPWRGSM
jgi:hypothetical protein